MAGIFVDSLYDAVVDCLKVVPILFLAYLLVAFLSHDHSHKFSSFLSKNKKSSVFYASLLGCVPQCGFSSVMADLYSERKISLGALVAVFVATSDEAIPLMLANPDSIVEMLLLIVTKILLAIFWGYLIELLIFAFVKRKKKVPAVAGGTDEHLHENTAHAEEHEHEHVHAEEDAFHSHLHECGHIHTDSCSSSCGHSHGDCCGDNIFVDAFDHTLNISIYIFVATFIINIVVALLGDNLGNFLLGNSPYIQILLASLIGLIPNCASSILLVELNIAGLLTFPALVAGLTAGAGVGLVILFTKNKKHPLENLGILLLQYCIGVVSGIFLTIFF